MNAAEAEGWLERHAVRCDRYGGRFAARVCKAYQVADPGRCRGCERFDEGGQDPAENQQSSWLVNSLKKRKRVVPMSTKRACAKCGAVKSIVGRGLCPGCYRKARLAEGDQPVTKAAKVMPADDRVGQGEERQLMTLTIPFARSDLPIMEALHRRARGQRRSVENGLLVILGDYLKVGVDNDGD